MSFGIRENRVEEKLGAEDEELNPIHGGMTIGGETMAAKRKHVQLAEVSTLTTAKFKRLGIPPILFS